MTGAIERFFETWGMSDDRARAAAIESVYSETGTYADPRSDGQLKGPKSISKYVDVFSANAPGWTAKVVASDETTGVTRCTVAFAGPGPDGEIVQHGQYFADMNGDQIKRLVGFVGTGAAE